MPLVRLQKFLSSAGYCSRRQGEVYIQEGKVRVNGQVVTELGTKVDPDKDTIDVNGQLLTSNQTPVYIALHKPRSYVTTCSQKNEKIVLDLVDIPQRIFPVGRLDKDSTGLLLMTNDGNLHHHLLHPSFDHEKEYMVTVAAPISDRALKKLEAGVTILGSKTRPAVVRRHSPKRFFIQLKEGRNRQIRRMVRKTGNRVTALKRVRVANIDLGDLPEGAWRHLTEKEIQELLKSI
ncbi:MAG: rRNA pseudouridine synthase [Deltaproteobacteria bacterium]|jgi:23S rRNA pseudouridine2605 synthase/23S rRNA pseudouridine2604 synthase|nr:rRNA pseudouridine synthase [Deltaproteobacteria bacterium]